MNPGYAPLLICLLVGSLAHAAAEQVKLDKFIETLRQKRDIPGLSVAIIKGGVIVKTTGYGFADTERKIPVSSNTLFQAGSISKPVSASGALCLVEKKQLALDADVNTKLRAWKIPENEFTTKEKVTLRRILSHSAGLTVHGFRGYQIDVPLPTVVQVLNGEKPANSAAVIVNVIPGTKLSYSGGGYVVMQQLLVDVTGQSFPTFMRDTVLVPLGMVSSSFEQPSATETNTPRATGYYKYGSPVEGRWHVYPEMAAAGLWTTAADLARFAIGVQEAYTGKTNSLISQSTARQMLTENLEHAGLGLFLEREGKSLRFKHAGRDEGFDSLLVGYAETGDGAALLTNCNDNTGALERIIEAVAREYKWKDYP